MSSVRSVSLRTTANTDTRTIQHTMAEMARMTGATPEQMVARMAGLNLLKVPASTADTAKAAAFLASDRARMFTCTVVNSTAAAAAD